MVTKKRGLGRGLDALLSRELKATTAPPLGTNLDEIPIEWIQPGRYQPRQVMDDSALQELADSIKAQGLIQPLVLRCISKNHYEIVAGERRWRASQLAGLTKVPAMIKAIDDEAAVAMSLIENIQREDLNPMEEALALQRLLEEFNLTHQQIAEVVGKSRVTVTNMLRLIHLSPKVAQMLMNDDIDMGHARALLSLGLVQQTQAAKEIASRHLNVRQAEAMVRKLLNGPKINTTTHQADTDTRQLENRLALKLGQPVAIQHSVKGKGKLMIKYNSLNELDGILKRFGDLD